MAKFLDSTGVTFLWSKIKELVGTKQDVLVSGTNIKRINGQDLTGPGELEITGGETTSQVDPVNSSSIQLDDIRNALLEDGSVKEGTTFQEFIEALMVKVNAEVTSKATVAPKIAVSGALTSNHLNAGQISSGNVVLEVGANEATYTLVNTATEGQFTDGQIRTHKITMGKSADSYSNVAAGCVAGATSWNGDESGNTKTVSVSFTEYGNGQEAAEETKQLNVGNITITKAYAASVAEAPTNLDDSEHPVVRSSYGNALYSAAGEAIPAGNATANTTTGKTVNISTKFYSWVKDQATLGNVNKAFGSTANSLVAGNKIIFPVGKTCTVTWKVLGANNSINSQQYTEETKYLPLPSAGSNAGLVDVAPGDAPYKTYKVWTITSSFPTSGYTDLTVKIQ